MLSLVAFLSGCQKEIPLTSNSIDNSIKLVPSSKVPSYISIDKAKTYFEAQLEILKRERGIKPRGNINTDATFEGLDVRPQWDKARIIDKNFISFVEVPFSFSDSSQLSLSTSQNN